MLNGLVKLPIGQKLIDKKSDTKKEVPIWQPLFLCQYNLKSH